jgi:drug/metabolite transporter (DMT)-like permease
MDVADIVIALVAAMLLGVGFVLQQHAAEQAPKAYFLRLQLITDLLHRPRWLAGLGVMVAGQLCSAWAVGHLQLSLAEPLLATNLIFALALAVPLSRQQLRPVELIGAVILSGGVAALSLARSPGTPDVSFGSPADWPAAAGIAVVAYFFVHAGRRRSGQQRAILTGIGAGLVFGISDALTRRTVQIMDAHGFITLFTSWPAYCVLIAGLVGLWLLESSFNAAPLHASLPGITAAQPLAGILLGVVVFGDVIRISPAMLTLQAAGIVAVVVGVIMVARAPVLSSLRHAPSIPHLPARPGRRDPRGEPAPAAPGDPASPSPRDSAAATPAGGSSPAGRPGRPNLAAAAREPNIAASTGIPNVTAVTVVPNLAAATVTLNVTAAAGRPNVTAATGMPNVTATAGLRRHLAAVMWILAAGYRAMMRRPGSLGEG